MLSRDMASAAPAKAAARSRLAVKGFDPRYFDDPITAACALASAQMNNGLTLSVELIASLLVASSHEPEQMKMVEKMAAEKAAELKGIILEAVAPDASKASEAKLEEVQREYKQATKGGATPFGSGRAWADALEDIELLDERPLIEQERQLNAADVSKDANDIQSANSNFRATRKAMFGEIGKQYLQVIKDVVEDGVLGKANFDKSPRIQKVCWLQPFDSKNSVKKGRREYPKTGDLPLTNKLPDAICIAFHDVGFTLDQFQRRITEIVSPAAYIDPGSRQKANDTNVKAWDGTIPLPKELFDIYGFNTQASFKVHGFKGEVLAGNEMRITLDLTYNGVREAYTTVRTVNQDHKGGGIDYCAGNVTKSAWFTDHATEVPSKDSYLFVLLKELGDFLQVIYAKMYMGHANPQVCMFTNDKTVLGRCYKTGVPVCYQHHMEKADKVYENLGQCYYFRPNFDPTEQRKSLKLSYQKQAIENNEKVKLTIIRALAIQGTKADYGDVFYITCGGQDITNVDEGSARHPSIRAFLLSIAEDAINGANQWLDACIGTRLDADTDESVEECRLLAARATADIVCNEVLEINKLKSLFKPISMPPIAGIEPLVDPIAAEFKSSKRKLNDYILYLSQQLPKKGAAARSARGRRVGGQRHVGGVGKRSGVSKSRNVSVKSVRAPLEVNTDQPITGIVYDITLRILYRKYSSHVAELMRIDYYEPSQLFEFYTEYLNNLAYEFLCFIYNYLNYVGRTPTHTGIITILLELFIRVKLERMESPSLEEFQSFYNKIEAKEIERLEKEEDEDERLTETLSSVRTVVRLPIVPEKGSFGLGSHRRPGPSHGPSRLGRTGPTRTPSRTPASQLRLSLKKKKGSLAPVHEEEERKAGGKRRRRHKTRR